MPRTLIKRPQGSSGVAVFSPDTLYVIFSKAMDSTSIDGKALFTITPPVPILAAHPVGNDFVSVLLALGRPLQADTVYSLTMKKGGADCAGIPLEDDHPILFGLPQLTAPLDIVINEILSDPSKAGVKYVELYNRSPRIEDLKNLNLASLDSVSGAIVETKEICPASYLLFPGNYVVLSTNGQIVQSQYHSPNPDGFIDLPSMPKMNIGGGGIALVSTSGLIIDEVVYSASWQFPLLLSTKGVSLERINYDKPTQDAGNWHSAAETVGFGTPAYRNSEYMTGVTDQDIILVDPVFSPDEDGHNDVLLIEYKLDAPDYLGTVQIFDSRGKLIKFLFSNLLLGIEGTLTWDGTRDNLEKGSNWPIHCIFSNLFRGWKKEGIQKSLYAGR